MIVGCELSCCPCFQTVRHPTLRTAQKRRKTASESGAKLHISFLHKSAGTNFYYFCKKHVFRHNKSCKNVFSRHTQTPVKLLKQAIILLLFSFGCALGLFAQERRVQNKPYIDERRFHYGFFVGLHDQSLNLANNGYIAPEGDATAGQQWVAQTDQTNFGFSVGVLGEWRMNRYLGLRIMPSLHFGSRHITFRELSSGRTEVQDMKSCYMGVPVNLKIAAPRFNNYRPYVVAGVAPMYDLITSKQAKIRTKPFNLMIEAGMGCDLYMPFFKFIPELKFCFGLGNVLQKNRRDITDPSQLIYTQSIDRATVGMVILTFYFE